MSGEFRWCERGYLHDVFDHRMDGDAGQQPLSVALLALYKALQPFECACAYVEACDSGVDYITVTAMRSGDALTAAMATVERLVKEEQDRAKAVLREDAERRASSGSVSGVSFDSGEATK